MTPRTPDPGRRRIRAVAHFAALACFGFLFCWTIGVDTRDESWFLQVLNRVAGGEVLYRDVFFGAGPLSVLIAAPFGRLTGANLLAVKALNAVFFAATVLILLSAVPGRRRPGRRSLLPWLLVYALPYPNSLYSPLAVLFLSACMALALRWIRLRSDGGEKADPGGMPVLPAAAGVAAGLAFAAKQNAGVLAFLALTAAVLAGVRRKDAPFPLRTLMAAAAGFAAAVLVFAVAPPFLSGGLHRFLDYGFFGKGAYAVSASHSYFGELGRFAGLTQLPLREALTELYFRLPFVLPLLAPAMLVLSWRFGERGRRPETIAVFFFVCAADGLMWPRADFTHLLSAVPILLAGAHHAVSCLPAVSGTPAGRMALRTSILWPLVGLAFLVHRPAESLLRDRFRMSRLPHFRGALLTSEEDAALSCSVRALAEAVPDGDAFLIGSQAGFHYLAAGLRNPTPFDYPLVSAFGGDGLDRVRNAVAAGRIPVVCVFRENVPNMTPVELIRTVTASMRLTTSFDSFDVYTAGPVPVPLMTEHKTDPE